MILQGREKSKKQKYIQLSHTKINISESQSDSYYLAFLSALRWIRITTDRLTHSNKNKHSEPMFSTLRRHVALTTGSRYGSTKIKPKHSRPLKYGGRKGLVYLYSQVSPALNPRIHNKIFLPCILWRRRGGETKQKGVRELESKRVRGRKGSFFVPKKIFCRKIMLIYKQNATTRSVFVHY